jgi:hypothetical protein
MKNVKVIKQANLAPRLPLTFTAVAYLLLDKFDAAGWIWGVLGTLIVVIWIASIVGIVKADFVDIWEEIAKKSK